MIVMPSNNAKGIVHYWAGQGYPVGWLFTPESAVREPVPWIPYSIDNGRFAVWSSGKKWNEHDFLKMLDYYNETILKPRFVNVPDEVGDADETKRMWDKWYPILEQSYDLSWSFCVQDGMTPADVPTEANVVFVGGTMEWKLRNLTMWTDAFQRVHVGAINTLKNLLRCKELGVESCDGTGWFRGPKMTDTLHRYFRIQAGEEKLPDQMEMSLT